MATLLRSCDTTRSVTNEITGHSNLPQQVQKSKARPFLLMLVLSLMTGWMTAQTITTGSVTGPFCAGSRVNIPYTFSGGTTTLGTNVFTAQLSDASGSFANPVNIGTFTNTNNTSHLNWTVPATIPANVVQGTGYRVRVVSSAPAVTGSANSANITLYEMYTGQQIFVETMGTLASNSTVAAYETANNFDNDAFTMSSTGGSGCQVVPSSSSTGYTGASGGGNIRFTNSSSFTIAGINTTAFSQLGLGFGILKNSTSSDATELTVAVSTNGTTWTNLSFNPLPTGGGTNNAWYYRVVTGTIPSTANLRIRFTFSGSGTNINIDDIELGNAVSPATMSMTPTTNQFVCNSGSVTFTATSVANAIYEWSTGATTTSITTSSSGNYSVTASDLFGCAVTRGPVAVTIQNSFTPSVSISSNQGTTICPGTAVTFTATPVAGGNTPTYQWRLNGSNVGTNSPTYTNSSLSNGNTVSVVMTSSIACASPTTANSNTISMTVQTAPTAEISGSQTICSATSANLSIAVTGSGPWTGTLSNGQTFSGSSSPITVVVSPTATTSYTVASLSDANCSASAGNLSGSATVTVNARPTAVISGSQTICASANANLSIAVTGTGPWSGTLSNGQTFSGSSSPISVTVSPSSNTTYTVSSLSDANCAALAGNLTGSAVVSILPRPVGILSGNSTICAGQSANVLVAVNGTGPWSGTLSNGTTFSGNSSPITVQVSPSTTTTLTIASLNDANCSSLAANLSGSATVTVNPLPTPSFTSSPGASSCAATNVTYTTQSGMSNYSWTVSGSLGVDYSISSGSLSTSSNTVTLQWLTGGSKTVTVGYTSAAGCPSATSASSTTLIDDEAPSITAPSNLSSGMNGSACNASVSTPNPTLSDNCSVSKLTWSMTGATVATSPSTGMNYVGSYSFNEGVTTVTYTAFDAAGNSAGASFTVTVTDTQGPQATCPANQTLIQNASCLSVLPDYASMLVVSDNCSGSSNLSIVQLPAPGTTVNAVGVTTVNFLITDLNGNQNTCLFNVSHIDNIQPTITCPGNQNIVMNASGQATVGNYISLVSASDGCTPGDSLYYNQIPAAGTAINGAGPTLITVYVTDDSGNISNCTFNLNHSDAIAPQITCPSAQDLVLDANDQGTLPDYTSLAAVSDNISAPQNITVTQSPAPGTAVSGAGLISVQLTATDAAGNSANCSFNVNKLSRTRVDFATTNATYTEGGTAAISVAITNPSSTQSTTVQVVLQSGNSSRLNGYTSQTVTFPAGSSANQTVSINIADNADCEADEDFAFVLQNVSGGNSAMMGNQSSSALRVEDDETLRPVFLNEDVEDGDISGWEMSAPMDWASSNVPGFGGNNSINHNLNIGSGNSWISYPVINLPLPGVITEWNFSLDNYGNAMSASTGYMVYVLSDKKNVTGPNVSGYVLAANFDAPTESSIIKLWKLQNGALTSAVLSTGLDINTLGAITSWRIIRDDDGLWTVYYDADGGANNFTQLAQATDTQFLTGGYFGVAYEYIASTAGEFAIDDLSVNQRACSCTYYSQGSGASSASVWATQPAGTPAEANFSAYANVVIQPGHTVNLQQDTYARNFTVQSGGTFNASNFRAVVTGNMSVNGTFNSDNGTVDFRGTGNQQITGSNAVTFNNLEINNFNGVVSLNSQNTTSMKKVVLINSGTLQTNDKLRLISNASGTASVGAIADGADLIGKVTTERYIPTLTNYPYGGYLGLGCPVQGCTIQDWNDDIITTGFAGSDYPPPYSFNNIQWYNETVAGNMNAGYVPATNVTNPLHSDRGYFVYMQTAAQLPVVTGNIYKFEFNAPLSYTNTGNPTADGYNLMVNQYPSEVDFKLMANNGNGVTSYQVFDAENNNYKTYNAVLNTGNAPRYIASSQAFFVKVNAPGAFLKYRETYKSTNGVAFERDLEEDAVEISQAVFRLKAPAGSADEVVLALHNNATPAYDELYDVFKIDSPVEGVVAASLVSSEGYQLTMDTRSALNQGLEIPVHVKLPAAGSYTFSVVDLLNLEDMTCMVVEDLESGHSMRIAPGESMEIIADAPYEGNRLLIRALKKTIASKDDIECHGEHDAKIMFTQMEPSAHYTVSRDGVPAYAGAAVPVLEGLSAGHYIVTISYPETGCESDVHELTITEPEASEVAIAEMVTDDCTTQQLGRLALDIRHMDVYEYKLMDHHENIVLAGNSTQGQLALPNLPGELYTVQVTDKCGTHEVEADLRDPEAVEATLLSEDLLVTIAKGSGQSVVIEQESENAEDILWSLSNGYQSMGAFFQFFFNEAGEYTLTMRAQNGACYDEKMITIKVEEVLSINEDGFAPVSMILSSEYITFGINQTLDKDITFSLFDVSGKEVWHCKTRVQEGKQVETGISQLAHGVYVVRAMIDQSNVLEKKIMK